MGCMPNRICLNVKQASKKPCYSTYAEKDGPEMQIQVDQFNSKPHNEIVQKACGYVFHTQKTLDMEKTDDNSGTSNNIKEIPQFNQKTNELNTEIMSQLLEQYQKCSYFYSEHNIDQAKHYADEISKSLKKIQSLNANKECIQMRQQNINKSKKLTEQVYIEYADVISYDAQIKKGGWVQKSNKKGVKISTRKQQTTVGVLVEAEIQTPFEILISVLIQMDLYKDFMPFMKVSSQEKKVARNCRIGYSQNNLPFLTIRQAFFQGIGYDRLQHDQTLFLYTRSIHNRPDLQKHLGYQCKVNGEHIQLQYRYFVLKYHPIKRGRGKITLAMNVDVKLNFLPLWVQDKISEDFGQDFLKNILEASKKFKGSEWEKNVQKDPRLFNFFKNAVDNYLSKQQIEEKNKQK